MHYKLTSVLFLKFTVLGSCGRKRGSLYFNVSSFCTLCIYGLVLFNVNFFITTVIYMYTSRVSILMRLFHRKIY